MKLIISKIYQLLFLVSLHLTITTQDCETLGERSTTSVVKQRQEKHHWWQQWITYHEYPIIYNYTICTGVALEIGKELEIKNGSRENVKYILFKNSNIPVLPIGVFTSFTNVTELYLNSSGIVFIHPGAFSGIIKLEKLYLQDNKIKVLERGVLNYLSNLRILDLSRNVLMDIEDRSLFGLLALKEIYLKDNILVHRNLNELTILQGLEIVDLSRNNLTYFTSNGIFNKLQVLLLNNNKLKNFGFDIFENSNCLRVLDLSSNSLSELDFSYLPDKMESLNISNNEITDVKNWPQLRNVESVDLSYNKIKGIDNNIGSGIKYLYLSRNNLESLTSSTFTKLKSLIELDLSHNLLTQVVQELFRNLVHLEKLHLDSNTINILTVGCFNDLASLKFLNLSNNLINILEYGAFTGLSALEELYVDHNSLTVIHENSFHVLESLKTLFLNDNSLTIINVSDLLDILSNLKLITLQNNNWNCNNLFKIAKGFREKSIDISYGLGVPKTANIYGISCQTRESREIVDNTLSPHEVQNTVKSGNTIVYANEDNKRSYFYEFFQIDFRPSKIYNLLNLSFISFFNDTFKNLTFLKYIANGMFLKFFKNDIQNFESNEIQPASFASSANSRLDVFIEQNQDLITHFQSLSNRIIEFLTIMITIFLVFILLFLFIILKPNASNVSNNLNNNTDSHVFRDNCEPK